MNLIDKILGSKNNKIEITPILPQEIYEASVLEMKDVIAPSALKISPKDINLGGKMARTFFVISYPKFLTDNWFSPVINLDKEFDVAIYVHPIETATILKKGCGGSKSDNDPGTKGNC